MKEEEIVAAAKRNAQWVETIWNGRFHSIEKNLFPITSRVSE